MKSDGHEEEVNVGSDEMNESISERVLEEYNNQKKVSDGEDVAGNNTSTDKNCSDASTEAPADECTRGGSDNTSLNSRRGRGVERLVTNMAIHTVVNSALSATNETSSTPSSFPGQHQRGHG